MATNFADLVNQRASDRAGSGLNLALSVDQSPDDAALNEQLARRWGVSADTIASERDVFHSQAKAADAQAAIEQSPKTQNWLAANKQNAAISHDDVGILGHIENGFTTFANAVEGWEDRLVDDPTPWSQRAKNLATHGLGALGAGALGVVKGAAGYLQGVNDQYAAASPVDAIQRRLFGASVNDEFSKALGGAANLAGRAADAIAPDPTGSFFSDQLLGAVKTLPSLAAAIYGGAEAKAAGYGLKAASAIGASTFAVPAAGEAYQTAREQGLAPTPAFLYGNVVGAEQGAAAFATDLPFLKASEEGKGLLARYFQSQLGEQFGMQGATLATAFTNWAVLPSNKDKTFGDFVSELPEQMLETGVQTALVGAGLNFGGAAVERTLGTSAARARDQRAAQEQADANTEAAKAILEMAGNSATRERDPQTFQSWAEAQTQDGPLEHVYVDARRLNQILEEGGAEADLLARKMPSIQEQLSEAVATGGDVRIPTSELVTHLPGSGLEDQIVMQLKADPMGYSAAEVKEGREQAEAQLQQSFETELQRNATDDAFQTSRGNVTQHFVDQLTAANRFTPDINQQYGSLLGSFYSVQASRLGITPEEMLTKYPLEIKSVMGSPTADESATTHQSEIPSPTVNIGLDRPDGAKNTPEQTIAALRDAGVNVEESSVHQSNTESTVVARLDRPLTDEEANRVSEALGQEAIAQRVGEDGKLHGPEAAKWGDYNPEYFLEMDGRTAAQTLADGRAGALVNLPANAVGPFPRAKEAAASYATGAGLAYVPPREYVKVDKDRAKRIADAFEAMEHNPQDPLTKAAYDAMIDETLRQWEDIKKTGLKVEFIEGEDPYGNPRNAILDVRENNHLWVYPTDSGFGSSELDVSDNPLLAHVEGETISGKPVRANDIFRIVHDYFGHIKEGVGFRADGEENAWRAHSAMYSPLARRAMTTETRGQNSWVNYGPHGEANRKAGPGETVYAPQKIGLLPEWVTTEGATDAAPQRLEQRPDATKVVDEHGVPKLVYHGTTATISGFAEGKPRPTWFAEDPATANMYADPRRKRQLSGGALHPVYLDVRNALDMTGQPHYVDDAQAFADQYGIDLKGAIEPGQTLAYQVFTHPAFTAEAKRLGYDGLKVDEGGTTTWAPFNVNQIKPLFTNDAKAFVKPYMMELAQGVRGYLTFGNDITAHPSTIHLLESSDLSTMIHESAHFFLEVMSHMASQPDAPIGIRDDMAATLKYLGFNGDNATWRGVDLGVKREMHENFARSFEAFAFEGKAPSAEMRGVFQRFRSWLVSVYKNNVANLRVKLTPEIRGVFDRLIASENAIREAEAEANLAPKFDTKPDGMTEIEWQEYQQLGKAATADAIDSLSASSLRDMQFAKNAHARELKRLQKENASKREAVEAEITNEVSSQPVYRAIDFMRKGTIDGEKVDGAFKMSKTELKAEYQLADKAFFDSLRPYYTAKEGEGIHPQQVAEMFGFSSVDEMIQSIRNAPKADDAIQAATDLRMLERYGDINSPAALDMAASRAIHNEVRARFIASELRALERGQKAPNENGNLSSRALARAAKTYATQVIRRLKVRDLRPAQYEAAERKAGANAMKALKAGDTNTARIETRNQLINFHTAREARAAEDAVQKAVAYFRKFDAKGVRDNIDNAYLDQIDALLSRFLLRRETGNEQARRASLASWIESQREKGMEPALDPRMMDEAFRTNYRDMTVDEMMGLRDSIKNIEHLGRLKDRLLKNKEQRELAVVVGEVNDSITGNAYKNQKLPVGSRSWVEKMKAGAGEFLTSLRKFSSLAREMDGGKDGGAVWTHLSRPMNEASEDEALRSLKTYEKLKKSFELLKGENTARRVYEPAIDASISLEDRLMMALNWGNELNRQRLMDGHNYTQAQIEAVLSKLTAKHWQFVRETWDHINSHWGEVAAQAKRIDGVEPEKQDALAFQIRDAEGNVHTLPGGYFPIKYDLDKSSRADANSDAEIAKNQMRGAYTAATTRRGFIKDRAEKVIGRPLRLDFSVISQHHREVIHDLAWRETLMDVNRVMRKSSDAIRENYGAAVDRAMKNTILDVAAGRLGADTMGERFISYIRSGVSTAGIAWNIKTGLFHLTGFNNAMMRIGPEYMAKGIARVTGDAAKLENTAKWIEEQSDYMRLRRVKHGTNIADVTAGLKPNMLGFTSDTIPGYTVAKQTLHDSFHMFIDRALVITSIPTWAGAYEKAVDGGADHARAVKMADQAVRDSHGSNFTMDKAGVERSKGIMKLFTSFYMWFNTSYNQLAESVNGVKRVGAMGVPAMAGDFLLFSLSGALMASVWGALNGEKPKAILHEVAADQVNQYISLIPIANQFAPAISQIATGKQVSDYKGPPLASVFVAGTDLAKAVQKGDTAKGIKAANRLGGVVFHYPAAQVQRTAQGIMALADGKTKNPAAPFVGAPRKHD